MGAYVGKPMGRNSKIGLFRNSLESVKELCAWPARFELMHKERLGMTLQGYSVSQLIRIRQILDPLSAVRQEMHLGDAPPRAQREAPKGATSSSKGRPDDST